MALKWIKSNISSFGGDSENVTVFGESAGAASIGYHLMSPLCEDGLFHKAIFQSGSPNSRWAFMTPEEARKRSRQFLEKIGYSENNNDDLVKFLKALDINKILENDWIDCGFMNYPWVPTIDGHYLYDEPRNLMKQGKLKSVDSILGCNLNEGSFWCVYDLPERFSKDDHKSLQTYSSFQKNLNTINWDLPTNVKNSIEEFYKQDFKVGVSNETFLREATDHIAGDRGFVWPTIEFTNALSLKGATTYLYYLKHRASNEVWPDWMGVIHGADIQVSYSYMSI